jgi:hypothetical protein
VAITSSRRVIGACSTAVARSDARAAETVAAPRVSVSARLSNAPE